MWNNQNKLTWVLPMLLLLVLGSCDKEHCTRTYTRYTPVYKSLTDVRKEMKSGAPRPLKVTGKLYIYGQYIFLNEQEKGIHIIDNSNPAAPRNIAFINIPGNVDLAVKGSLLYADSWSDLVTFDISNPQSVTAKSFLDTVFPNRSAYMWRNTSTANPDSVKVLVDWIASDTTMECETYNHYYERYYALASADSKGNYAAPRLGGGGMGGSMARFTLINDYLYTVTTNMLNTFNLSVPHQPSFTGKVNLNNWGIETIFPFKDKLFIGSNTGMYIYSVANPAEPQTLGTFTHVRSCDPVIADDDNAFVTLRTGTSCQGTINRLEVLDINNLSNPRLVKTYDMKNPHGLSKEDDLLFICDGEDGLKVYDAAKVSDIKLIKQITGINAYDVIAFNKRAIVVAQDGLYQYNYTDANNIKLLSKIEITKQ